MTSKTRIYRFPRRDFSAEELAYGLWIGMAFSTNKPHFNAFDTMKERSFDFYSISHLYRGSGKIKFENQKEQLLRPGSCIVVTPGVVNRYGSYGDYMFFEDSVKFSGPVADMFFKAGIIRSGVFNLGTTRVLRPIVELMQMPSIKKRLHANFLLQEVLMKLYLEEDENKSGSSLDNLLKLIGETPTKNWTLNEMAEICQCSKNQLRLNFLRDTGTTPKKYVDAMKIRYAAELLKSSDMSVVAIAARLGYEDPYHFSRRFKQLVGIAPEYYRKQSNVSDLKE
ncbi:MAG: AraC family transcriptional regulator [Lentisphaerae bacterium]|nr:AraC family transcriptional regulator [Lentisphaerota bacterium]